MAKKEEVYYDAQGNPVVIKKKRNPFLLGCLGLVLLMFLIGACSAIFLPSNDELTKEDKEVVEDIVPSNDDNAESDDTTAKEEKATEENTTTEEETTTEEITANKSNTEKKSTKENNNISREHVAALAAAQNYVDMMPFSKAGLYDQLTSDAGNSFPPEAAQYAIDNVEADFKEEAVEAANSYNETFPMSDQELLQQLTSEAGSKFTQEEAQYALQHMDK